MCTCNAANRSFRTPDFIRRVFDDYFEIIFHMFFQKKKNMQCFKHIRPGLEVIKNSF